jgi:hypothetical protein
MLSSSWIVGCIERAGLIVIAQSYNYLFLLKETQLRGLYFLFREL